MENSLSSNNSKESSWALYVDHYMLVSEGKVVSPRDPDQKPNYTIGDASYYLKDFRLKKRRRIEIPFDDSLEDTASSPVNHSKGEELYNLNARKKQKKDAGLIFQMKTNVMIQDSRKHIIDEGHEVSYANEIKYDCNALRRRGLCLIPLSVLVDYFG
ncbi:hypothetical protein LUZ61_002319 [Rhynchospora tenuis]|uniref:Uncharacterized protein n=1 Tax=Rhynchospora tenuis TaxID=198213 RepID=A0AAD5ZIN2_9POAL|nr:hypothetical protein LUZ61_002319 [Rhynchospora tenuis]